jgi:hypothetical protein
MPDAKRQMTLDKERFKARMAAGGLSLRAIDPAAADLGCRVFSLDGGKTERPRDDGCRPAVKKAAIRRS